MSLKNSNRPLVTLAIITYNQEKFVKDALEAAVTQSYRPIEVVVSDDCSTDSTAKQIREFVASYEGDALVRTNFHQANQGMAANVNTVVNMAAGNFVALAAGDDISMPKRLSVAVEVAMHATNILHDSNYHSVLSSLTVINDAGEVIGHKAAPGNAGGLTLRQGENEYRSFGLLDLISGNLRTSGPSRVFPKAIREIFGDIDSKCSEEDIIYLVRTVLAGQVNYLVQPTVKYRIHGDNFSKKIQHYIFDSNVFNQINNDISRALQIGLISDPMATAAYRWAREYKSYKLIRESLNTGALPSMRTLATFSLSRSHSFKIRLKLILRLATLRIFPSRP